MGYTVNICDCWDLSNDHFKFIVHRFHNKEVSVHLAGSKLDHLKVLNDHRLTTCSLSRLSDSGGEGTRTSGVWVEGEPLPPDPTRFLWLVLVPSPPLSESLEQANETRKTSTLLDPGFSTVLLSGGHYF